MSTIITLDLESVVGFAIGTHGCVASGHWPTADPNAIIARIDELDLATNIDSIAMSPPRAGARALARAIACWARDRKILVLEIDRRRVRKQFTGNPNASRQDIAAMARWLNVPVQREPQAVALAVFDHVVGLPKPIDVGHLEPIGVAA